MTSMIVGVFMPIFWVGNVLFGATEYAAIRLGILENISAKHKQIKKSSEDVGARNERQPDLELVQSEVYNVRK